MTRQPFAERLHDLARKTEQRIGNHPEADLCRDAAKYITELEEKLEALALNTTTKPARAAAKKD